MGRPACHQQALGDRLVHADRGRRVVAADVGDVQHLEQALDRAVLAVRPMQDRKGDVDRAVEQPAIESGRAREVDHAVSPVAGGLEDPAGGLGVGPAAAVIDGHGDQLVAVCSQRSRHRPRGHHAHVVLERAAPEDQGQGHAVFGAHLRRPPLIITVARNRGATKALPRPMWDRRAFTRARIRLRLRLRRDKRGQGHPSTRGGEAPLAQGKLLGHGHPSTRGGEAPLAQGRLLGHGHGAGRITCHGSPRERERMRAGGRALDPPSP